MRGQEVTLRGGRPRLARRVYACVSLLSMGVLMLQIALNRLFSFTSWHHLAYISISLALLGFGSSGSLLAAFPRLGAGPLERTLRRCASMSGLSCIATLIVIGSVPVHLGDVTSSPAELLKLCVYFAVVTIPFFFAGLAIAIALREAGAAAGRLYFWDLVGAGVGCSLVVAAISWLETPRVLLLVGLCFCAAAAAVSGRRLDRGAIVNWASIAALATLMALPSDWMRFEPSRDKLIAPWLDAGTSHYSHWGTLYRTDLVGAADAEVGEGGYRSVGISPAFEGTSPAYRLVFHDGTAAAGMYRVTGEPGEFEMFRHHVLTTPYLLCDEPETLVIGVGGGADIMSALVNGASRIVGVELDPQVVWLLKEDQRDFTAGVFDREPVDLRVDEGRHFIRSTAERFDLIQLTGVDTLAALSSGAYILAENYLYTVEAYEDFLGVLRDDGIVSVAAVDFSPASGYARHALRFAALASEALRRGGIDRPQDHILVVSEPKGIAQFEVITKKVPFSDAEIARVAGFLAKEKLVPWYLPRQRTGNVPAFVKLLESGTREREAFFDDTYLSLWPTTDDQPFFFSFYKWRNLFEHRDEIDPGHLLATGQLVLVLILVLSIVFSVVAIGLPLWFTDRSATRLPGRWGFIAYFAALGAGFMFAEISFLQRFQLFLGHPIYSLTVVLFAFLVSAGLGAAASERLPARPERVLPALGLILTAVTGAYLFGLPSLFEALLAAGRATRIALAIALCLPLGGVLGTFFPYGIRLTSAVSRDFTAWAWAVNGCLSVVGSVASIMLATTFGFDTVVVLFVAVYWIGIASFVRAHARIVGAEANR